MSFFFLSPTQFIPPCMRVLGGMVVELSIENHGYCIRGPQHPIYVGQEPDIDRCGRATRSHQTGSGNSERNRRLGSGKWQIILIDFLCNWIRNNVFFSVLSILLFLALSLFYYSCFFPNWILSTVGRAGSCTRICARHSKVSSYPANFICCISSPPTIFLKKSILSVTLTFR